MEQLQQQQVNQSAETVAENALELEATAEQDSMSPDPGAVVLQPDTHNAATPDSTENNNEVNPQPGHVDFDSTTAAKSANATGLKSVPMQVVANDLDDSECVTCWEARASVLMQPCGPMCVGSGCVAMLRDHLCPMCRSNVLSRLTIRV